MKTLILTIATLISTAVFGQTFETDLSKSISEWNKGKHTSEVNFNELSTKYPTEWLPKYYLALSKTLQTLESKNVEQNEKNLVDIKNLVDDLEAKNPANTEILNLKALYLTSEIVQNPMRNGAIYYPEVLSTYQKAKLLNPNNPRTILGLAEFNINASNFSGMDITQDCENIKKSLALFDAEKPKTNEPNWGKDRAEALLNNQCKSK